MIDDLEFISLKDKGLYLLYRKPNGKLNDKYSLMRLKWKHFCGGTLHDDGDYCGEDLMTIMYIMILYLLVLFYLSSLILVLANDVESNPGPSPIAGICRLCISENIVAKDYFKLEFFIANYSSSLG